MQINVNDMKLEIKKSFYNKTQLQEDGVTYKVDTDTSHPLYQFDMYKNYFDVDKKEDMLELLIADMKTITAQLENQLDKMTQEKEDELSER